MSQSDNDALIQAYGEYLEFSKGRARGTVDGYLAHLARLTRYLGDRNKGLQAATAEDLEQFTGLHLHERGGRPRSRRPAIAAVRGFYAWAERKGLVDANPATGLAYPQIGRKLPETMPLRAVEAMLMCAKSCRLAASRCVVSRFFSAGTACSRLRSDADAVVELPSVSEEAAVSEKASSRGENSIDFRRTARVESAPYLQRAMQPRRLAAGPN